MLKINDSQTNPNVTVTKPKRLADRIGRVAQGSLKNIVVDLEKIDEIVAAPPVLRIRKPVNYRE